MLETIYKVLLSIHVPVGFISLILFWIPVAVKKGSPIHRKVGKVYFYAMWTVLGTAFFMSLCNFAFQKYDAAIFLGFLSILTAYPLWYAFEILNQKKGWSDKYFTLRKAFTTLLFVCSIAMVLFGAFKFNFSTMGIVMCFFGLIGIPAGRDMLMSKTKAMNVEGSLKMHIQGTIISGIAAHTAFFVFGGQSILFEVLHLNHAWIALPWIAPSVLGFICIFYMNRKYRTVNREAT